ncbi:unnamed protein product [Chironomus riparius]|uniref:Peptidase S1 domain-containing protein n=1 Tax=Chironomus riparius TaxID=315576 RepID=A0A9N9SAG4_9DIPT|nr:unnamed protein product [Chironomus riparius]
MLLKSLIFNLIFLIQNHQATASSFTCQADESLMTIHDVIISGYACDLRVFDISEELSINVIHLEKRNDDSIKIVAYPKVSTYKEAEESIFEQGLEETCQKFKNLNGIAFKKQSNWSKSREFNQNFLKECRNLEYLDISENNINHVSVDFLNFDAKLKILNLEDNILTELPEMLFDKQREIERLYLGMNWLYELPGGLFSPLKNLRVLDLHFNNLLSLKLKLFNKLGRLEVLKLNRNSIFDLPAKIFSTLVNLNVLDLSQNKITDIHPETFTGLRQLEDLNLQFNEITALSANVFISLQKLINIELSDNKVEVLHPLCFVGMQQLETLNLQSNQILDIPENIFEPLNNLKLLNLQQNKIQTLSTNSFNSLNNLEQLILENNKIAHLPFQVFSTLTSLKALSLNSNQIATLTSSCFCGLQSLEQLYMIKNKIEELSDDIFNPLFNLKILNVGENKLKDLNENLFLNNPYLIELAIHSNEISELPPGIFKPLTELETLWLYRNQLTDIHSISFGTHEKLKLISLWGNKIDAIDKKLIEDAAFVIEMKENLCNQDKEILKHELELKLSKCFENYQNRFCTPNLMETSKKLSISLSFFYEMMTTATEPRTSTTLMTFPTFTASPTPTTTQPTTKSTTTTQPTTKSTTTTTTTKPTTTSTTTKATTTTSASTTTVDPRKALEPKIMNLLNSLSALQTAVSSATVQDEACQDSISSSLVAYLATGLKLETNISKEPYSKNVKDLTTLEGNLSDISKEWNECLSRTTSTTSTTTSTTAEKPTTTSTTVEKLTTTSTTVEKPTTTSTTVEKPTTTSTTVEKPTTSSTTVEKPTTSSTTVEKPTTSSTTVEKPTTSSTTVEKPTASSTTVEKPTTSSTTVEKPTTSSTTVEKPTTSSTTVEKPTTTSNATEKPKTTSTTTESKTTPNKTTTTPTESRTMTSEHTTTTTTKQTTKITKEVKAFITKPSTTTTLSTTSKPTTTTIDPRNALEPQVTSLLSSLSALQNKVKTTTIQDQACIDRISSNLASFLVSAQQLQDSVYKDPFSKLLNTLRTLKGRLNGFINDWDICLANIAFDKTTIALTTQKPSTIATTRKPTKTDEPSTTENPAITKLLTILTTLSPSPTIEITNLGRTMATERQQHKTIAMDTCGKMKIGQQLVFGGSKIQRGSFPWKAALYRPNGDFFCSGTIISTSKVITAAHCIWEKHSSYPIKSHEIRVGFGIHNLFDLFEAGKVIAGVKTVHIHPDWNAFDADIAVLELTEDISFKNNIQLICMIQTNSEFPLDATGVVAGFGRSENHKFEFIANVIKVPILSYKDCQKHVQFHPIISHRTICGGYANGTGVCNGDSGSGLVVEHNGSFYLRGIVSASLFGEYLQCDVNDYAVFTDVTKFDNWIKTGNDHKSDSVVQEQIEEIKKLKEKILKLGGNVDDDK